ncbi:hypothetical protein [Asaia prunellae]|uniref:hypothetical protein n=1 Tax=Asaia prunellae TaxID=610245 RepID=UPI00047214EE|nr:hypothetical protein [Asaia prunellae]
MAQTLPFPKNETPAPLSNVIPLRFNVLPRHREYLSQWLQAGLAMGLCDADIETEGRDDTVTHILIWVRENADPAYMIKPRGMRWVLIDHIREHELGVYASLERALHTVRPVLPLKSIAAA